MSTNLLPYLLLADRAHLFRNMGNGFRQKQENFNPAQLLVWALLLIALFVVLNVLSRVLTRREKRQRQLYCSPRALFRALCRVHQLDRPSRRLLKQLAASHRLQPPAQIFLKPDCFNPEKLSPPLQASATRLAALQHTLFGSPQQSLSDLLVHREALEIAQETNRRETAAGPRTEAMSPQPEDSRTLPLALPLELGGGPGVPFASTSDAI